MFPLLLQRRWTFVILPEYPIAVNYVVLGLPRCKLFLETNEREGEGGRGGVGGLRGEGPREKKKQMLLPGNR
jgi:hypothetical protein